MLEGGDNQWFGIDDANTQFWCLKSTGGAGPDGKLISPESCIKGRMCYKVSD